MSGFSMSPRLVKGALVSYNTGSPKPNVIVFQYNPETMTRSLQGQSGGAGGQGSNLETFGLKGPPSETITLEIEMDATDALELPDQNKDAVEMGLYPQLSALELLLYPSTAHMLSLVKSASSGVLEVIPPERSFTLFVWGQKRIVPVQVTKFDITEEAFDTNLNPIRAKVSLGLRVLSYADLSSDHPGFTLFFTHQMAKEEMASKGISSSVSDLGTGAKI
jgi:hypothetical protein